MTVAQNLWFFSFQIFAWKIIVSNGKTLLIRNKNSSFANTYKTENTYFKYILNKEFLISKIQGNVVEKEQYFLLSINDKNNQLNIFFVINHSKYFADWLNEEVYPSVRGKKFKGNHVHSIVKKKRLKDEKLEREYPEVWSDFSLEVVDKTILMSDL